MHYLVTNEYKQLNISSKNYDRNLEKLLNCGWTIEIDAKKFSFMRRTLLKKEVI